MMRGGRFVYLFVEFTPFLNRLTVMPLRMRPPGSGGIGNQEIRETHMAAFLYSVARSPDVPAFADRAIGLRS